MALSPGVEALGELARSGELGEPLGLRCRRLGWGNAHPTSDTSWHLAPHDLSIALEILGPLPAPRFAIFEGPASAPRGLSGVLGERPLIEIEVSASRHVRDRSVQLDCSDGVAWLPEPMAAAISIARSGSIGDEPELRPISDEMPLLRELRRSSTHLEGGPAPRSSAAEAAETIAVLGRAARARGPAARKRRGRPGRISDALVSVVMPSHDHGPTLRPAVRSALAQTHSQLELLIVGDGMPAAAADVARELEREHERVRLFEFEKGERHGEAHRHTVLSSEARATTSSTSPTTTSGCPTMSSASSRRSPKPISSVRPWSRSIRTGHWPCTPTTSPVP